MFGRNSSLRGLLLTWNPLTSTLTLTFQSDANSRPWLEGNLGWSNHTQLCNWGLITVCTPKKSHPQQVQNIVVAKREIIGDLSRAVSLNKYGRYSNIQWKFKTWSVSLKDSCANGEDCRYALENSTWSMLSILTVNMMTVLLSIIDKRYIGKHCRT